ncbi:MAG: FG-GAP-like repeat-containing protein [Candidatus Methanofastidiosia archaeon]|jgi:TolB protein
MGYGTAELYTYNTVWDSGNVLSYPIYDVEGGDTDSDGNPEIIVSDFSDSEGPKVYVFENTGDNTYQKVWDSGIMLTLKSCIIETGDLDKDGKYEIIVVEAEGPPYSAKVHVFECTGDNTYQEVWNSGNKFSNYLIGGLFLGDADSDGNKEIILGRNWEHADNGKIYILECTGDNTYQEVWNSGNSLWDSVREGAVGDTDGDGKKEIVVGSGGLDSYVHVFECTGDNSYHLVASVGTPDDWRILATIGDADGDGHKEIIASGIKNSKIHVFENTGDNTYQEVWNCHMSDWVRMAAIGDQDKDGNKEIIVPCGDGKIYVFECTGDNTYEQVWNGGNTVGGGIHRIHPITVGDHDKDGKSEIISAPENKLYVFEYVTHAENGAKCLTQLTATNPYKETNPHWSPDGEQIIYQNAEYGVSGKSYPHNIWVMNNDGSNQHRLTHSGGWNCNRQPKWSPDGEHIVFWAFRPFGQGGSIWTMNSDGSNQTKIHVRGSYDASKPAFSPDGTKIVFNSCKRYGGGPNELYIMNPDGSNVSKILNASGNKSDGRRKAKGSISYSPDGQWIVFESERAGNWDIWIVKPDGSDLTQITTKSSADFYPAWSPDGEQIVFTSDRSGNNDIWILTNVQDVINGGVPNYVQITTDSSYDRHPTWSPDGKKIAFSSDRSGNWDIWIVDVGCVLDSTGPESSSISVNPDPTACASTVTLTALVDDTTTGNSNIQRAEYFIDVLGTDGTGTLIPAQDGSFDSPTEKIKTVVDVTGLSPGLHTLYVHGKDSAGNWGPTESYVLQVEDDCVGPVISSVKLKLNSPKCPKFAKLKATVDDTTTGNSNIQRAEYFIDTVQTDGTGALIPAQDGSFDSPTEKIKTVVDVAGLSPGLHTLYVHGKDSAGNWGDLQSINFDIQCSKAGDSNKKINKQMYPVAQYNISRAKKLSIKAQEMLSQARAQEVDISEAEKIIGEAEKLLVAAQNYFRGKHYITANICALEAIETYQEAIELLKNLLD